MAGKVRLRYIALGVGLAGIALVAAFFLSPAGRGMLTSEGALTDALVRARSHLLADSGAPNWLFYFLVFLSVPTVYLMFKSLIIGFVRHVLRRELVHSPYTLYKRDMFYDIPWVWSYSSRREPEKIWCECGECRTTLVYEYSSHRNEVILHCESCDRDIKNFEGNVDYLQSKIGRLIMRKIKTGEWQETITPPKTG